MNASTKSAPNVLLMLCSATAIMMSLTGMLFLIGARLLPLFAHGARSIGEIDAVSIALIFGGIAVALKTIEIRLRTEHDLSTE
jgi:hypothetical protein